MLRAASIYGAITMRLALDSTQLRTGPSCDLGQAPALPASTGEVFLYNKEVPRAPFPRARMGTGGAFMHQRDDTNLKTLPKTSPRAGTESETPSLGELSGRARRSPPRQAHGLGWPSLPTDVDSKLRSMAVGMPLRASVSPCVKRAGART